MRKSILVILCVIAGGWLAAQTCLIVSATPAWAQEKKARTTGKSKKKAGNTTTLDNKANEIQAGFIKEAEELANGYFEAGDYDKSRILLRSIQALDPNHPQLDAKLKRLDEESITSNAVELEVNSHDGWVPANILVSQGKPIRIKAEGSYKLSIAGTLGPAGLPGGKSPMEFAGDLPIGALIGYVPDPNADPNAEPMEGNEKDKKKERAFFIGGGCDYVPTRTGPLMLRINCPDNKNTGKIKVQITGTLAKVK
jgi:hypothetical protein